MTGSKDVDCTLTSAPQSVLKGNLATPISKNNDT